MSRVHFLLTAAVATLLVVCAALWYSSRPTLPPEIRIAAGQPGGMYHTFAQDFAKRLHQQTGWTVRVIETTGSGANAELLRNGGAELALIQTTPSTLEGIVGVAPLFPEFLHFLAKSEDMDIHTLADLKNKRVGLGMPGSGIRQNANVILPHYGLSPEMMQDADDPFGMLIANGDLDAALVITGWMNPTLEKVLRGGNVKLIGLADAEGLAARYPWLIPATIPRGLYSGHRPVPPDPVQTVAVMALLTARSDAHNELVNESLAALYETDQRASYPLMLSAKAARDYDAAVMHPAAGAYHDPAAQFNRLSQAMELASKSKEAMVGVAAFGVLAWGWFRRRRERFAEAADREQKQKLDAFINRALTVELEQMEVADPEQLRTFLQRVTHIKQEALRELTSERVRGDQLFAIFLSQCAALSEKIQMRMIYGQMQSASSPNEPGR